MRPVVQTLSSATASAPVIIDYHLDPGNCGIAVVLSGGDSLTYGVQYTLDEVCVGQPNYTASPTWWTLSTLSAQTASATSVLAVPARAIRLNVTAYTSGTATMTIVQAGSIS